MKIKETFNNARSGIKNKILSSLIPKDIKVILAVVLGVFLLIAISVAIAIGVVNKNNQIKSTTINEGEKCIPKSLDLACAQDLTCFAPLKSNDVASEFGTCIRLPKVVGIAAYCKNSTDGPQCEGGLSCQFLQDDQFEMAAKCAKI
jgi:hypothetical protein